MNSVLQSLFTIPKFVNYFSNYHKDKPVSVELSKLILDYGKKPSLLPKKIFEELRKLNKDLKPFRQEDAHEFLLFFLDSLHEENKIVSEETIHESDQVLQDNYERSQKIWNKYKSKNQSIIYGKFLFFNFRYVSWTI